MQAPDTACTISAPQVHLPDMPLLLFTVTARPSTTLALIPDLALMKHASTDCRLSQALISIERSHCGTLLAQQPQLAENSPGWLKQAVTRYALSAPKGARTQRVIIIITPLRSTDMLYAREGIGPQQSSVGDHPPQPGASGAGYALAASPTWADFLSSPAELCTPVILASVTNEMPPRMLLAVRSTDVSSLNTPGGIAGCATCTRGAPRVRPGRAQLRPRARPCEVLSPRMPIECVSQVFFNAASNARPGK